MLHVDPPVLQAPDIMDKLCEGQRDKDGQALQIRTSEEVLLDPSYTRYLEKVTHYMFGSHWAGNASAAFGFSHTPLAPRPAA